MYDVGISAVVAADAFSIAKLALRRGQSEVAKVYEDRGKKLRRSIFDNLWDEESGIFVNRYVDTSAQHDCA